MKNQRKQQYKSRHQHLSTEYAILNEEQKLVGNFKTAKEAIEYKTNNPGTTIYILKTFKF